MLPTPERMMIVQQGAQVLKCGTFGKPHHQFIQLDDVNLTLRCFSPKTKEEELKKPNTVGRIPVLIANIEFQPAISYLSSGSSLCKRCTYWSTHRSV